MQTCRAPDAVANVGGFYAALRDAISGGDSTVADFDHAVKLTHLVADPLRLVGNRQQ